MDDIFPIEVLHPNQRQFWMVILQREEALCFSFLRYRLEERKSGGVNRLIRPRRTTWNSWVTKGISWNLFLASNIRERSWMYGRSGAQMWWQIKECWKWSYVSAGENPLFHIRVQKKYELTFVYTQSICWSKGYDIFCILVTIYHTIMRTSTSRKTNHSWKPTNTNGIQRTHKKVQIKKAGGCKMNHDKRKI